MAKQALEGSRLNAFGMDPNELVIVGLDTEDGVEHPLYDERVKLKLDEALVRNIMFHGVIEPVTVTKDGDGRPLVVVGRQRVRCAREANKRLEAEGKASIVVPVMVRRGEQTSMFGVMVSENECRQGDLPLTTARKAAKFMQMGRTETEACVAFGVSKQTMGAWIRLLELEPALLKAVERNEISASQALEQAGGGVEVQRALAEKVKGKAPSNGKKPKAAKGNRPGKAKVLQMYESINTVKRLEREAKALAWVLGKIDDDEFTG